MAKNSDPAADASADRDPDLNCDPDLNDARRFHWTGNREGEGPAPVTSHPFLDDAHLQSPYPLWVGPGDDGSPSCRPLAGEEEPEDGGLVLGTADDLTPIRLFAAAAEIELGAARAAFSQQLTLLSAGLQALLDSDRRRRRQDLDPTTEMGALGSRFLDPAMLTETLRSDGEDPGIDNDRQERIRGALEDLAKWDELASEPVLTVVTSDPPAEGASWQTVQGDDPCTDARELFDRAATRLTEVLRAVRLARLELASDYEAERHEPWLRELDWQGFDRHELKLLPRILARLEADGLTAQWLPLSRLMLSGRPVQVMVTLDPSAYPGAEPGSDPLTDYRLEPASLGLGLREALVQQGIPARPDLLLRGFTRAIASTRAGFHVVASATVGEDGYLRQAAAVAARAHPLFLYDPEAGATWPERLDFSGNPRPDLDWPGREGETPEDGTSFTFADFAAFEESFRGHFLLLDRELPAKESVPVDAWLALPEEEAATKLPSVRRAGADGISRQAVITRRLALACRDRLDFWRSLQELAGARGEVTERAAERGRRAATAEHARELERVRAEHAVELERVRTEAAREAVQRVLGSLLGDVTVPAQAARA